MRPQDQTKAKAKITRPRSRPKPDRAVLNHSQASARCIRQCDKLKQVVQLNFVKVTSTCRYHSMCVLAYSSTAVNVSSYSCKKIEFKKMLSARSFHSDQTKTSTTSPRPRTKPARPRPRPKPYSASLRPVL